MTYNRLAKTKEDRNVIKQHLIMAKKKVGFTNKFEENALRESALIISEQSKHIYSDLVPHRVDNKTVILVNPNKDIDDQVQLFIAKLECNRIKFR